MDRLIAEGDDDVFEEPATPPTPVFNTKLVAKVNRQYLRILDSFRHVHENTLDVVSNRLPRQHLNNEKHKEYLEWVLSVTQQ